MKSFLLSAFSASMLLSTQVMADTKFEVTEIASGLKHPWGIAFLPDGSALITERAGGLIHMKANGDLSDPIPGLPDAVVEGQGGILGLAVHPDFESNSEVYVCLSVAGEGGHSSEVHKGVLKDGALTSVTRVFQALPKVDTAFHFGCRVTFDRTGDVFISLGDRGSFKEKAQETDAHFGKVVRVTQDGKPVADNPFIDGKAPEIYTYGHRNVQGMTMHPQTGAIWTHEHGPKGGDEINILNKGDNYGWPSITYGVNYNGSIITDKTEMDGMRQPLIYWDPSIAPSGMTFYTGDVFPQWQGDLFIGSLKFRYLKHLEMDGDTVVAQNNLLEGLDHRIRDVAQGPDGNLYVITDAPDGKVLKIHAGK
ncbi:PQQ-dependent sugar dehydrogenase [Glaciecola siphonariae]|uniref:PQQ-dependent sugar dehydrogenase n=1 Tax=Glaciecola siphonariae TaxID=521012 RepID=A0ABV9LW80_9ALTE